jgi:hypothetical protein
MDHNTFCSNGEYWGSYYYVAPVDKCEERWFSSWEECYYKQPYLRSGEKIDFSKIKYVASVSSACGDPRGYIFNGEIVKGKLREDFDVICGAGYTGVGFLFLSDRKQHVPYTDEEFQKDLDEKYEYGETDGYKYRSVKDSWYNDRR